MRARKLILILLLPLVLSGCSTSGEVENQAHALVLGIDRAESGGIGLTVRIPRIGKSAGDEGGSGEYLVLSAEGDDYAQALEYLQWAVTRDLNLGQLRLLVVSEALAREEGFPALINAVAATHHLFTAARFVVCEGSAKDFVSGQEIIIGTRLSSELSAMFRHYADHGAIPDAAFADVFYASGSVYSDPVAIWGFVSEKPPTGSQSAAALMDPADDQDARVESPSSRYYLGAAVFREGRLAMRLDSRQTLYYNLIMGRHAAFDFDVGGRAVALSLSGRPKKRVEIDGDRVTVILKLTLTTIDRLSDAERSAVERALAEGIADTIRACQDHALEPFGFAQKAARRFLTLRDWLAFGWRERFSGAQVRVEVRVHASEA